MRKALAVILCLVLVVSIAACGKTDTGTTAADSGGKSETGSAQQSGTNTDKRVKLTFLCQINVDTEGYDVNDNPYINYLRDTLNIDIEIISES